MPDSTPRDAIAHLKDDQRNVEEEEKRMEGLFAQARKAGLDMDVLGGELAMRKQELTESFKANGLPKPQLKTMDEVSA
jgi:hypothetical protein